MPNYSIHASKSYWRVSWFWGRPGYTGRPYDSGARSQDFDSEEAAREFMDYKIERADATNLPLLTMYCSKVEPVCSWCTEEFDRN